MPEIKLGKTCDGDYRGHDNKDFMNAVVKEVRANPLRELLRVSVAIALFCFSIIAIVWGAKPDRIFFDRASAIAEAEIQTSNLVTAYEDHMAGVMGDIAGALQSSKRMYGDRGTKTSLRELVAVGKPDGSYGGVVYALVDPLVLLRFCERFVITLVKLPARVVLRNFSVLTPYSPTVALAVSQSKASANFESRERNYYLLAMVATILTAVFASGLILALAHQRRVLNALGASNARFGVAFNQAAVGIAMAGLDGRLLEVNAEFCRMLGYDRAELLARTFLDITHPDDRRRSADNAKRMLDEHGETPLLEKRYVRKDGRTLWVVIAVSVVRDIDGAPQQFMGIVQDITERKRAELVLADNERRFRALIENSLDIIVVTDGQGTITFISPSVTRLLGYSVSEVEGRNFLEFAHPDDIAALRNIFAEIVSNPHEPRTATRRYRHKNGAWIALESIATNLLDDPMVRGIVVNGRDITVRAQTENALIRVNRARKALSACNNILIRASNEETLVQKMCDNIVESGGYLLAWVGVVEHNAEKSVRPVAYAGYQQGFMEQAEITYADNEQGRGPVGMAIRKRKIQVVQNALNDPDFKPWHANAAKLGYGSLVALPLIAFDDVIGVLTIYAAGGNAFDDAEMTLLVELADDLAFGIATLRTRVAQEESERRLLSSMEGTILAMAATLEMRDAYTAGHQRRVADLVVAIAREMRMPEDDIHGLHLAAVIHDLGKIQVPAEILSKPTRLTAIEYELIKTHPESGYKILKDVDFPWPIAQLVYQHHERLDGSGYPRGLKGTELLPGARILAVADTVEAMASHRPYRAGLGVDKALEEIMKNRASIYDADVVDACVTIFRERRFAFSN